MATRNTVVDEALISLWRKGLTYSEMIHYLETYEGIYLSERQIKYKMKVLCLTRTNQDSEIIIRNAIQVELDSYPSGAGYRTIHKNLRLKGFRVTRHKVENLMRLLDPAGVQSRQRRRFKRGTYRSNGPNETWHMDGHDKLVPFGIGISGCIDGFSRKIIWLKAARTNHDPSVIASYYLEAVVENEGCPEKIRADLGTENCEVAAMQVFLRRNHLDKYSGPKSILFGKSTSNQRIEQFWSILLRQFSEWWRQFFHDLTDGVEADINFDKCLIRFCFLDIIQSQLQHVTDNWNSHRIRKEPNLRVPCGVPSVLYDLPQRYGAADHLKPVSVQDLTFLQSKTSIPSVVGDEAMEAYFKYVLQNTVITNYHSLDSRVRWYNFIKYCAFRV